MDEMTDILAGLDQRISSFKTKLAELQKKRDRVDEEIRSIKKYLEHAEILYKVEKDKAQAASQSPTGGETERSVSKEAGEFLLGRSKYSGTSIPQAAFLLLKETGHPLHAKEIYSRLMEGGLRIKGKTPITSIAISLNRDKRFVRTAPNTFKLTEEG
jgi:hypothetical protein